jgi:hypothetical protein
MVGHVCCPSCRRTRAGRSARSTWSADEVAAAVVEAVARRPVLLWLLSLGWSSSYRLSSCRARAGSRPARCPGGVVATPGSRSATMSELRPGDGTFFVVTSAGDSLRALRRPAFSARSASRPPGWLQLRIEAGTAGPAAAWRERHRATWPSPSDGATERGERRCRPARASHWLRRGAWSWSLQLLLRRRLRQARPRGLWRDRDSSLTSQVDQGWGERSGRTDGDPGR